MLSDEALHERLLRGELGAFDQLYDRYHRPLFGFIRRHLADAHEAEDVLHETFLALLREREGGLQAASLRGWLFQVARNLCLNRLRSRRRGARALEAQGSEAPMVETPDHALEGRETAERLRRAVEALPAGLSELYALRAGGLSYEELAEALAVPVGTVKSRMHELVRRLREELER
ncbi:MAG: sigma-70 family RNA polymerase sigma factor [Deltaproteobacteria bacterium]|nr:sigma-70 family RNA polymerase sigma factor [Deltaproteobacteria bacterium]